MDAKNSKDLGPRKALGRGLAALMPPPAKSSESAAPNGLRHLPLERIHRNKTQPRKHFDEDSLGELAASIDKQGILQPIVVRHCGADYEIVAGERRWLAAAKAGLQNIPALVTDLSDSAALQVALIENIQRQDLDPLEEAEAYHRLIQEHHLTHDNVAEAVGKSRSTITNSLRLLKLPADALAMLADGRLTAGHARALMSLGSDAAASKLAEEIVTRGLPVREAERRTRQLAQKRTPTHPHDDAEPSSLDLEEKLQRHFGTKVRVHQRQGKGRLEIFFHSLDHLDDVLDRLLPLYKPPRTNSE